MALYLSAAEFLQLGLLLAGLELPMVIKGCFKIMERKDSCPLRLDSIQSGTNS
jgi:hypothetical protein